MTLVLTGLAAVADWLVKIIHYEIIRGNELWRFAVILLVMLTVMVAGRIVQFIINSYCTRRDKRKQSGVVTIFFRCLTKPLSVALFSLGLLICRAIVVFGGEGIRISIGESWLKIVQAVAAVALSYALYRMVDIIEHYLLRWTSRTKTRLDDMLVPVIRKSLRVTIAIIATLWIADGILDAEIQAIILSAGVGGIAVALAAKDTIANFFGSIMIFADRPFQVDELIDVDGSVGSVEEVGFRSTKIRTLEGHLVTIPNNTVANSMVKNISRRPFIRRTSNLTITYDSGHTKAGRAVEIIKEVLADVPEVNGDPEKPPRVYFSEFNDWSLNIYMSYWVRPADYWLYHQVNERVNMELMKRFEAESIDFAFPTQTLHVRKDSD